MWTLVYLVFIGDQLESSRLETYNSMFDCFDAREALSYKVGGEAGFFPPDHQAICIFREGQTL